jgi:hypothetical protein
MSEDKNIFQFPKKSDRPIPESTAINEMDSKPVGPDIVTPKQVLDMMVEGIDNIEQITVIAFTKDDKRLISISAWKAAHMVIAERMLRNEIDNAFGTLPCELD